MIPILIIKLLDTIFLLLRLTLFNLGMDQDL